MDYSEEVILAKDKIAAWTMFGVGMLLLLGWPVAIFINWENIVHSETRLGYLIGDVGLVTPLCFLSWCGLKNNKSYATVLFSLTAGALAYDVVHFGIFLIQIKFLSIPAYVYIILIAVILFILYKLFIFQAIKANRNNL